MNNTEKGYASGAHAKFGRTPMPACSEWNPFPSRAKKKRPLCILPTHPLAVANRPLPCNVGGFGIPSLNKKGTIFRTGKPVPNSALLATNIASIGGAGVRHGEDGGDAFFARDGLGCDGVALL